MQSDHETTLPPALDRTVIDMLRSWQAEGQPDPVAELVSLFELDGHDRLVKLRYAVLAGDIVAARRAAHSLKGMSGSIGALYLSELSGELEKSDSSAIDDARVRLIEQEFRRVSEALRAA